MVTNAHGIPAALVRSTKSTAPGRHGTFSSTLRTTPSRSASTISSTARSMPMCSWMYAAETVSSLPTRFSACASLHVPPYRSASSNSVAIQYGSVSTSVPSMSQSTALGRPRSDSVIGVVAEVRREPALGLGNGPALARGVVGDLVGADAADDEVLRLRVGEVPARDGGARPHRHALGELDAGGRLYVEQLPQRALLGVLRARRVARGRPDAA